jgi:hypothetical protein
VKGAKIKPKRVHEENILAYCRIRGRTSEGKGEI